LRKNKKVMDIAGANDRQHNNIGFYRLHNGMNQQWELIYADEMPDPPRRGELNDYFNMLVERPFHVVSALD
jgi:hypothetical protein